jgi:hypothetical protein
MANARYVVNGCFVLFVFIFVFRTSDSMGHLIRKDISGRVYSAVKGEKRFAIKRVLYETKDEIESGDNEERMLESLSGLCPYLMSIEDSFEDVFVFFIYCYLFAYFYNSVVLNIL